MSRSRATASEQSVQLVFDFDSTIVAVEGLDELARIALADDPERDWDTVIEPAMAYRQRKYLEWAGEESKLEGMTSKAERHGVIIGTPDAVARRLLDFHHRVPFDDLAFWYRLPGVGHEQAVAHLERVTRVLVPLLAK